MVRDSTQSAAHRPWLLAVLVSGYACSFVDRIIISVVGQSIIVDLGLTDLQFGLLGGAAFALLFSLAGIPLARLAERRSRVTILSMSIAAWSLMTMLCGVATSYAQLFLARMGVGIGEAGFTPASHSLLSDHYPPDRRASALSIFSTGAPLGAMIGAVAGGALAERFGWQAALILVGAPGLLLALVLGLTIAEPARGGTDRDGDSGAVPPLMFVVRTLLGHQRFRHLIAGAVLVSTAGTGINVFGPPYLLRQFALRLSDVGVVFGVMTAVSGVLGMLAGGTLADRMGRSDPRWRLWIPAAGALLAAPLEAAAYRSATLVPAVALMFAGGFCAVVYLAPTFAVAQNFVVPRMRASASAVVLLAMNVFGQGVGPFVIGGLSDLLTRQAFTQGNYADRCAGGPAALAACASASATGLGRAMALTSLLFAWGSLHFYLAGRAARPGAEPTAVAS